MVGLDAMAVVNLKIGVFEVGGVGGLIGCIGPEDGGKGAMDSTVAIALNDERRRNLSKNYELMLCQFGW